MEIRKDRLQKAIEAVKNTDDAHWNMATWMRFKDGCNTVGCAIGSYCVQNPGCGLILLPQDHGYSKPVIADKDNFDAVAEHFGISYQDAYELFDPEHYMTDEDDDLNFTVSREMVIHRLEQFINDN